MTDGQMNYLHSAIINLNNNLQETDTNPVTVLQEAINRWGLKLLREVFNLREISMSETLNLIKSLGNSNSFGDDELDTVTLKTVREVLKKSFGWT